MRWYCISWVTLAPHGVRIGVECCVYGCRDIALVVLRACWTFVIARKCAAAFCLSCVYTECNLFLLASVNVCLQLQRLKRSLSFKTIMRSKSVENFFQRSYSDARLPPDFITDPPPPSPPLMPGSPLVGDRSPSISPSLSPNPSIASHSPSLSLSPSLPTKPPRPQINHCFQDHVFRKPTNCQHCKHMIVGKVFNLLPVLSFLFFSYTFLASFSLFMWPSIWCRLENI